MQRWRRLGIIIAAGVLLLLLALRFGPAAARRRGIDAAEQFKAQLAPTLAADPRFAGVGLRVSTHPALFIYGEVPDERSWAALHDFIHLPPKAEFHLIWAVKVANLPVTRPER